MTLSVIASKRTQRANQVPSRPSVAISTSELGHTNITHRRYSVPNSRYLPHNASGISNPTSADHRTTRDNFILCSGTPTRIPLAPTSIQLAPTPTQLALT